MSNKALTWAWKTELNYGLKVILAALADYANTKDICWPTIKQLMKKCGMGRSTMIKNLKQLEQQKYLFKEYRYDENGNRRSTLYKLNTSLSPDLGLSLSPDLGLSLSPDLGLTLTNTITPNNKQTIINPQLKEKESIKEKEKTPTAPMYKKGSIEVLNFLNECCIRNYQPVDVNLSFITNRLKELCKNQSLDEAVSNCRAIIAKKRREWLGDEEMKNYLRPATLFNKTKFHQYFGELLNLEENE